MKNTEKRIKSFVVHTINFWNCKLFQSLYFISILIACRYSKIQPNHAKEIEIIRRTTIHYLITVFLVVLSIYTEIFFGWNILCVCFDFTSRTNYSNIFLYCKILHYKYCFQVNNDLRNIFLLLLVSTISFFERYRIDSFDILAIYYLRKRLNRYYLLGWS